MQAHILSLHTPSTRRWRQKIKHFPLKVFMLHIKFKANYTHPRPLGWGKIVKIYNFIESSHVAYQIKGNGK